MTIHRKGSYLYARAYMKVVGLATLALVASGAALAVVSARALGSALAGALAFALVAAAAASIWLVYLVVLWAFAREAQQAVEIGPEGVREIHRGREKKFIPWEGVNEIELDATVVAGASIKLKGRFSTVAISNLDLVITEPMPISRMNAAIGQTKSLRELLAELRALAPNAELRTNRLARKRRDSESWIGTNGA